jgi:hypothetical protein
VGGAGGMVGVGGMTVGSAGRGGTTGAGGTVGVGGMTAGIAGRGGTVGAGGIGGVTGNAGRGGSTGPGVGGSVGAGGTTGVGGTFSTGGTTGVGGSGPNCGTTSCVPPYVCNGSQCVCSETVAQACARAGVQCGYVYDNCDQQVFCKCPLAGQICDTNYGVCYNNCTTGVGGIVTADIICPPPPI